MSFNFDWLDQSLSNEVKRGYLDSQAALQSETKSSNQIPQLDEALLRFLLLRLPSVLRRHVLYYVMPQTHTVGDNRITLHPGEMSILARCNYIYQEAVANFYRSNPRVIDVMWWNYLFAHVKMVKDGKAPAGFIAGIIFPENIALRSLAKVQNFHIRIHYFIGQGLDNGVLGKVQSLCKALRSLSEIKSLHIHLQQYTSDVLHVGAGETLLEPFLTLRNTRKVTLSGPLTLPFAEHLSSRITDAYTKNSFLRLPPEIREMIYNLVLPYQYREYSSYCWERGNLSIAYTNKLICSEVIPMLYSFNKFQLYRYCNAKMAFRYYWNDSDIGEAWRRKHVDTISQENVSRIRDLHITITTAYADEGDKVVDGIAVLLQNSTNMKALKITFHGPYLAKIALKAFIKLLETKGLGNVKGFSLSMESYDPTIKAHF